MDEEISEIFDRIDEKEINYDSDDHECKIDLLGSSELDIDEPEELEF